MERDDSVWLTSLASVARTPWLPAGLSSGWHLGRAWWAFGGSDEGGLLEFWNI
jgi:hypothetical protein